MIKNEMAFGVLLFSLFALSSAPRRSGCHLSFVNLIPAGGPDNPGVNGFQIGIYISGGGSGVKRASVRFW